MTLTGFYRWDRWIILLGADTTIVISKPKNLTCKVIPEQAGLRFESDEDRMRAVVTGSEEKIKEFLEALGGKFFSV